MIGSPLIHTRNAVLHGDCVQVMRPSASGRSYLGIELDARYAETARRPPSSVRSSAACRRW